MKMVYADTCYWVAIVNPRDQWRQAAKEAKERLGEARIVTTDEVLVEFLNLLRDKGSSLRAAACAMAEAILGNPNVTVVQQSRESLILGLELYKQRADKEYSLVDCVSMKVMKKRNLQEVLTGDHHFAQEGLTVLMDTNT